MVDAKGLEPKLDGFISKYKDQNEILLSDAIDILKNISLYARDSEDNYTKEELVEWGNTAKEVVLNKLKSKEITGEDLNQLLLPLNVMLKALESLGFTPLTNDGKEMTAEQSKAFEVQFKGYS